MICTDCYVEITEENPVIAMCMILNKEIDHTITLCKECSSNLSWAKKDKSYLFLYPEEL